MPRSTRLLVEDQPTVYHVMSRTCLDGYPLGPVEKDYLLAVIKRFAGIYFCEILGFCIMGNHFHLLVRMQPEAGVSNAEVVERYQSLYGNSEDDIPLAAHTGFIASYKKKWTSLSHLIAEIKQTFSRRYNKMNGRKGYFWGGRFTSVIVEDGRTLVNCLAYIDLNPIRAGIAERPEAYRWCSLGYHLGAGNADDLLSTDFGISEWCEVSASERLRMYREYVYRTGAVDAGKGKTLDQRILERAESKNFQYTRADRFAMRTRWFTDSAIIGSKAFVSDIANKLDLASEKRSPKRVSGLEDIFAFRRLSELL